MAVELKAPPEKKETRTPEPPADAEEIRVELDQSSRYPRFLQVVSHQGLLITLCVSLVGNGATLAWLGSNDDSVDEQLTPEVRLGEFGFVSSQAEAGQVVKADFAVHIALSEDMEQEGRRRIVQRQFRLQQDMQQLLRGAHSGDFDDPLLNGLKRKLKERINKTLGIRAAADVIITDLKTERNDNAFVEEESAGLVPWDDLTVEWFPTDRVLQK